MFTVEPAADPAGHLQQNRGAAQLELSKLGTWLLVSCLRKSSFRGEILNYCAVGVARVIVARTTGCCQSYCLMQGVSGA